MNDNSMDTGTSGEGRPFTGIKLYYDLPKDTERHSYNAEILIETPSGIQKLNETELELRNRIQCYLNCDRSFQKVKLVFDKHSFKIQGREQCPDLYEQYNLKQIVEMRDFGFVDQFHGTVFSITASLKEGEKTYLFHCDNCKSYHSKDIVKSVLRCMEEFDENYSTLLADKTKRLFDTEKLIQECSELNRFIHEIESFTNLMKEYQKRLKKYNSATQSLYYRKKRLQKMKNALGQPTESQAVDVMKKIRVAFMYLARLKPFLKNPSSSEVLMALLPVLVQISGIFGIQVMSEVVQPHLTQQTLSLLHGNLQSIEYNFYKALGPNWNEPRIEFLTQNRNVFKPEHLWPIPSELSLACTSGSLGILSDRNTERLLGKMCSPTVNLEPSQGERPKSDYSVMNLEPLQDSAKDTQESLEKGSDLNYCEPVNDSSFSGYNIHAYGNDALPKTYGLTNDVQKIQIKIKLICVDDFEDEEEMNQYLDDNIKKNSNQTSMGCYSILVKQMPANFSHAKYCELTSEMKCVMDENVIISETHMESHTKDCDDEKSESVICV